MPRGEHQLRAAFSRSVHLRHAHTHEGLDLREQGLVVDAVDEITDSAVAAVKALLEGANVHVTTTSPGTSGGGGGNSGDGPTTAGGSQTKGGGDNVGTSTAGQGVNGGGLPTPTTTGNGPPVVSSAVSPVTPSSPSSPQEEPTPTPAGSPNTALTSTPSTSADRANGTPNPSGSTGSTAGNADSRAGGNGGGAMALAANAGSAPRTSGQKGGMPRATATTDSNGNTIPIATGTPGTGTRSPALPVSARIGIGLAFICAVLFLVAACFLIRRHRMARRNNRRQQWWSSRRPAVQVYRDVKEPIVQVVDAVSYTRSNTPSPAVVYVNLPSPPPTAEIRHSANLIDFPVTTSQSLSEGRFSIGSLASQDSSLIVIGKRQSITTADNSDESPSPSLQHHFMFPALRPPEEAAIDRTSAYFQPRTVSFSDTSLPSSGPGSSESNTSSIPETIVFGQRSGLLWRNDDPFADPAHVTVANHGYGYSTASSMETDPFSVSIIASSCYGTFEEFETVRVPFIGNLSDELSLRRGEEVRILKVFGDGWTVVEKSFGSEDAERGFIPVECLRVPQSGFRTFVYPPRVDSYTTSSAPLR